MGMFENFLKPLRFPVQRYLGFGNVFNIPQMDFCSRRSHFLTFLEKWGPNGTSGKMLAAELVNVPIAHKNQPKKRKILPSIIER